MRVLVVGAGGFIGRHILAALAAAGHVPVACVRNADAFRRHCPGTEAIAGDFARDRQASAWLPRLKGVDAVVNAAGIIRESKGQSFAALHADGPIALFDACVQAGVRRVVQISALGEGEEAFLQSKFRADAHLAALDIGSSILRPSLVHGPGSASGALLKALAALPFTPVPESRPLQPIHVRDLARAVVGCLGADAPRRESVACVGPAPLSLAGYLATLRRWLGLGPLRPLPLSYPLARGLARLGRFFGAEAANPEAIAMLARGSRADAAPFVRRFGFAPRSVEESLAAVPAWAADRWHARLYFLRAPLRWGIAFTWLAAGLASLLYPLAESLRLLAAAGLTGPTALAALYGGAGLDILLGLALLRRYRPRRVAAAQLGLMAAYTAIISLALPEFWLQPFGPVVKNLPLAMATLALLALEEE